MCWEQYWPPPCFEYVDLWQYSDQEIHEYIKVLCKFMNDRDTEKQKLKTQPDKSFSVEDIPF